MGSELSGKSGKLTIAIEFFGRVLYRSTWGLIHPNLLHCVNLVAVSRILMVVDRVDRENEEICHECCSQ